MDFYQYLDAILVVVGLIVTVILAAAGFKAEEQGAKKTCKRLAGFLLCLIVGLTIFYIYSNHNEKAKNELAARTEIIDNYLYEAQKLASDNDYLGAITLLKAALMEYPEESQLIEKLTSYENIVSEYENILEELLQEIDQYTMAGNYTQAITIIKDALRMYPNNKHLEEMLAVYSGLVLEEEKAKVLSDAESLFVAGEYDSALALIKAAQEAYGNVAEFEISYKSYHKKYTLVQVEECVASSDYINAIKLLTTGLEVNKNDLDLLSRYNLCCASYVESVILEANALVDEWKIDEAISIIKTGLAMLPDNEILNDKLDNLNKTKPISITNLKEINNQYWSWNEYSAIDTYGNDHSDKCNYSTGTNFEKRSVEYRTNKEYTLLSGIVAPSDSLRADLSNVVFRVYADDVLVYTSPVVNRKTAAFRFEIDITDTEFVKLETDAEFTLSTCFYLIVADVQLWP